MSKRNLSRRFEEEVATSPLEWLIGLRPARAKQMLEKTARSVDKIAYDTGFGSAPTLRHDFRRVLTRARLPIARIFGEIPGAKELGLVFVPAGQCRRDKGPVDLSMKW